MKHKGNTSEFKSQRDEEIARLYSRLVSEAGTISVRDIFSRLVEMPASRFWISETRAAIVVCDMMHGKELTHMRPTKREMFEEIYSRTMALIAAHPGLSLPMAVEQVVQQPAPKFYLTPMSARVILVRYRQQKHAAKIERLRRKVQLARNGKADW